jgi:DNA-binding transcriptional MerR regulator
MSASERRMFIGEVHSQLRQEYPDIELSKIRYYEDKGLVRPSRSRKGYRIYSERDVACLREAFRLAQQEYVPLKVVRQRLIEQGLLDGETPSSTMRAVASTSLTMVKVPVERQISSVRTEPPVLSVVPDEPVAFSSPTDVRRLTKDELLDSTGLTNRQLDELQSFGLVASRDIAGRPHFDECDLLIARRFADLAARGIEPRHLQGLKRTVDRQMDLLGDLATTTRARGASAEATAEIRELAGELQALRGALLARALNAYLGS